MSVSPSSSLPSRRGRGFTIVLGAVFVVIAVLAVIIGRGGTGWFNGGDGASATAGSTTAVRAVIGSEKRGFFEDPAVQAALAGHGYSVVVDTAGSRRIATGVDLSEYDLAFPSSAPAGQKIAEEAETTAEHTAFHSPMAIASFTPILQVLEQEGVAEQVDGTWRIDMAALAETTTDGTRWRDIAGDVFPSPRAVQVSTTDIRSSNSAAMYLPLLSWILNDGAVVTGDQQAEQAIAAAIPLFIGQGYTDSTSAGPFVDYLSQGMGSMPLVMIYESQFLGEAARADGTSAG